MHSSSAQPGRPQLGRWRPHWLPLRPAVIHDQPKHTERHAGQGSEVPGCEPRACMDWLERADLFFIPLDNRRRWYRYHHLWRELLEQRFLAELGPDQVNVLHRRAATWFASQGLVDEALRHALAADDLDLAAQVMEQNLCDTLNREDRPTLDRWLRMLPDEFIERRPWLLMIKALACQFAGQLPAVWKLPRSDRGAAG